MSDLVPASSPESSTVLGTQKALSESGNKQDEAKMTFKVVSVLSEAELRNHAPLGANQLPTVCKRELRDGYVYILR